MWSPYHYLYEIRKDKLYSGSIKTSELKTILKSLNEISPTGELTYINKEQYPPIKILIVDSENGNFSIKDDKTTFEEINLVEIEISKEKELKNWYVDFMIKIAAKLNWELILSADDDDNEDILIWKEL